MAIGFTVVAVILAQVDAKDSVARDLRGQELVAAFAETDWSSGSTIRRLDFTGDGIVDFADWHWMLDAPEDPESSDAANHWIEKWDADQVANADEIWPLRFGGQRDILEAFSTEVDVDGVLPFDLIKNGERVVTGTVSPDRGAVNQDDLAFWLVQTGALVEAQPDRDPLAGTRLILALALLGACLGFLPYNFNPAVIFLGDAGSLMLGFLCAVLILSLGSEGQTHYVLAGLIIFALPIMDTVLAIVRRKLAGLPMSAPDKNHIHHMMLRGTSGNVKKAVFCLYALNTAFVAIGVGLAATVAIGGARYLLAYGVAILIFGFVGAVAIKTALRHRWSLQLGSEAEED